MELAQSREKVRIRDKALMDARRESDGYKKELAEASEKVRVLEAKLTTARSELIAAHEARNLAERKGASKDGA